MYMWACLYYYVLIIFRNLLSDIIKWYQSKAMSRCVCVIVYMSINGTPKSDADQDLEDQSSTPERKLVVNV